MTFQSWVLRNFPGVLARVDSPRRQIKALRTAVARAQMTKFYSNRLKEAGVTPGSIRSTDDYVKRVPVTTRAELIEQDPYDLLAVPPGSETILYGQTSGSTGTPVPVWATLREMRDGIELALALPVFRKHLHPESYTVLAVGPIEKFQASLAPAGTVKTLEIE